MREKFNIRLTVALFVMLFFAQTADAATRTWDGGGATNNWSEAANWSDDTVPAVNDTAIFDSTSTKNCVMNINLSPGSSPSFVNLNSGYTGTVSVASGINIELFTLTIASGTLTLSDGNFSAGIGTQVNLNGGTINAGSGNLNLRLIIQNGGTFNGSTGNMISDGGAVLNGGVFNAPSANYEVGNNLTVTGGTFNAGSGTVTFIGGANVSTQVPVFSNLTINKPGNGTINFTGTSRVIGTLTLTDGGIGAGTVKAENAVNIAPTFDGRAAGGAATLLLQDGAGARTITLPAGVLMPGIRVNDANVTVNTSGTGTIRIDNFILDAGTVEFGANNLTINAFSVFTLNGGTFSFTSGNFTINESSSFTLNNGTFTMGTGTADMSLIGATFVNGGTFNASSGTTIFNINQGCCTFTQSGGIFNGNGTVDFNGNFQLTGGTFNASSGITYFGGAFSHTTGGTFNHSNGTAIFNSSDDRSVTVTTNGSREIFNNVVFDTPTNNAAFAFSNPTIFQINGELRILNGAINSGFPSSPTTGLEVRGDVTIGANADGGTAVMRFTGAANQNFTNNGGLNTTNVWTVDKTGGSVTLLTNLILQTSQTLNITSGELNQGAASSLTAGTINIGAAGVLKNYGIGGLTIGNSLESNGVIDFDANGAPCPGADAILIRSSVDGTRRNWSGTGGFILQDVDVKDQGGTIALTAFSSTDSGNNNTNWTFNGGELALVWDGGGATNNWTDGANWNRNVAPSSCNIANFNNTSTKNVMIDTDVTILGVRINPGYTGTISQGAATTLTINSLGLTQNAGTFATGANSNLIINGNLSFGGGNFNGGGAGSNADINGSIVILGGTFAAPNGQMFLSGNLTRNAGTFVSSAGKIIFDGNTESIITLAFNHQFNGFRVEKSEGVAVNASNTFTVNGPLELIDGLLESVSLEARNDAFFSANFDGGNSFLNLNGGTVFDNVYEVQAGAMMPTAITMNNSSASLVGTGAGTVTWNFLTLDNGQILQNQPTFVFNLPFTQNISTIFEGSGGDLIFNSNFVKTGGTFVSTNANLISHANFSITGGGFQHNGGTVRFEGGTNAVITLQGSPEFVFNNVSFGSQNAVSKTLNRPITVNGTLTFADGAVNFSNAGDFFNVKGDVLIGADFDASNADLQFSGTTQTVTNNGGAVPAGQWNVNSGTVSLASNLTFQPNQILAVNNGTFTASSGVNLTTGILNVAANGRFEGGPNLALNLAGNVTNNGRMYLSGGGGCPDTDTISLRSTVAGVQRNWSGAGRYNFVNVDAQDMTATSEIKIFSGTDSGNNTNWTIESGCLIRVTNTNDSGGGSLRNAIFQANTTLGRDTIGFDINGTAPFTISLTSNLPQITDSVVIDGTTQPGFNGTPVIELTSGLPVADVGLRLEAGNNVIKGLVINRFSTPGGVGSGIFVNSTSHGNTIQGNYIGTNINGTAPEGNIAGITLFGSSNNLIGGTTPSERNVISGNGTGISIGGFLTTTSSNNLVKGNFIGTNAAGVAGVPNQKGVLISYSGNSVIGGNLAGESNVIAFNSLSGVEISSVSTGNTVKGNSIHTNANLGIDLSQFGITANDPGDADTGANNLQNFPTLGFAISDGSQTTVQGTLNSTASSNYSIDFYSNPTCDANNYGEGRNYLGSTNVSTDAGNLGSFSVSLPVGTTLGHRVAATATDSNGNTSEFSQCRIVSSSVVSISGRLATAANAPITNATVRLTGSLTQTTITSGNGEYSFGNVPSDGTYTVTPTAINHDFAPANRTYSNIPVNQTNQNFTGTKNRSTIAGTIFGTVNIGGNNVNFPLSDVTVNLSGTASRTFNGSVQYFFNDLNPGTYTITPLKDGWTFSPPSVDVNLTNANQFVNLNAIQSSPLEGRIVFAKLNLGSIQANGTALTNFQTPTSVNYPNVSISSNGRKILYEKTVGGHKEIFSANADGSGEVQITNSPNFESAAPIWSPDGTKIVFSRSSQLPQKYPFRAFLMNPDGSGQTQLPRGGVWLSNTRLFNAESDGGGNTRLVSFNLDGTGLTPITNYSAAGYSNFRVSPDGTKIAFLRVESSQINYYVINSDGTNQTFVGTGLNVGNTPSWSPDSSRIAFFQQNQTQTIRRIVSVNAGGGGLRVIYNDYLGNFDWGPNYDFGTPTGSNIVVNSGGASVTFNGVSTAGTTTFTPIPPSSAGTAPNGFVLSGLAYEINTTAAYTSPVTVCFNVPMNIASTLSAFNQLALLHNEGGVLIDRTTSRNFATRTICGTVSTLSPFALGEQVDTNLPSITGLVQDNNGNPLSDVYVQLSGTENRVAQTDAFGIFTFVNLTQGGNYNVQPKLSAYLFNEYSQDFINLTGENPVVFTGTESYFQANGRVTDGNGNAVSGATVNLEGAINASATTDSNGDYVFTNLPADGTFTVFPSASGFSYQPNEYQINALTNDLTGLDFARFAPTAATSSISGRILTSNGGGVRNVIVTISGGSLPAPVSARTGTFGFYRFDDLLVGEIYTVTVTSKRYVFEQPSRVINLFDEVTDANFIADER